jgi:GTP-binding protein
MNLPATFQRIEYLASAGRLGEMPIEGPLEIAFAGRSNVGKSSAINALAGRRRLAFVSKTPGRTQTLNFFSWADSARLVDLPGYGYAKVPKAQLATWTELVGGYLSGRSTLTGVVLVMDARLPATPNDRQMLAWLAPFARARGMRLLALLSKADKLTRSEQKRTLDAARGVLASIGLEADCRLFSSRTGLGLDEARETLASWLSSPSPSSAWLAPQGGAGNKRPPGTRDATGGERPQ